MTEIVGVDIGGSNLRIGVVDSESGEIGDVVAYPMNGIGTNRELTDLIISQIKNRGITNVGISAPGVINGLRIKGATNIPMHTPIDFEEVVKAGYQVTLANDLEAISLAISRFGEGKDVRRFAVANHGTGYNCSFVVDGTVMTKAEFGHMVYDPNSNLVCGCGGKGHLEIYVSGSGAAAITKEYFSMRGYMLDHPILQILQEDTELLKRKPEIKSALERLAGVKGARVNSQQETYNLILGAITAEHIYNAYQQKHDEEPQKNIRKTQVLAIADSFGKIVSAYNPVEIIVLVGGLTNQSAHLINPAIEKYGASNSDFQASGLRKPRIVVTSLPHPGIQGAAAYFLSKHQELR